jgi:Rieske Fe-S protein
MNECAREAVLEAMEQNNLRPFTDARSEMFIENVSIPPPKKKKGNKKKSKRKKDAEVPQEEEPVEEEPKWLTFETMKEAIDAGWKVRCEDYHYRSAEVKN